MERFLTTAAGRDIVLAELLLNCFNSLLQILDISILWYRDQMLRSVEYMLVLSSPPRSADPLE
ncbi:uncharacterized protein K441DRAFT_655102 [Cenococcum geophilum 1.58]|uniref:uncharacterized protein n=1 Tax=Cenococcum geophilum 1.58 TaxID=794803 RepID=UPI0035901F64|nr:hypothetical protein K441DRAFT_655102 [Cenococcum geophilum 1.58]